MLRTFKDVAAYQTAPHARLRLVSLGALLLWCAVELNTLNLLIELNSPRTYL